MSKDKFDGHVPPHAGTYDEKGGIVSENRDKSSDKAQKRSDLSTHDTKVGKEGDVEEWKKRGAALYRLGNRFYEDRMRVLSGIGALGGIAERADVQEDAHLTRCLRGVSAKFWSSGSRMFCVYYEKDSSGKYGMYFAVFTESDTRVMKVSDAVFTKGEAKRAPPDFVMREEGGVQRIIFTFLVQKEKEEGPAGSDLSSLCVSQYTISERDHSIVAEKLSSILSSKDYLAFEGPLGITVHSDGNIIVIGKFKDPVRLSSSDVGYFAWKFSSTDLALIKPKGSAGSHNTYLFRVFGGSAYEDSERMIVWEDARENQLSITHIDKHLVRERSVYSTVYTVRNVDMVYKEDIGEKCLIESFRCGIAGPKTHVLRNGDVHLMDRVSVGNARYIFYISQKSDRKANGTVDMLMLNGDTYLLVEGIFHIGFSTASLSVNPTNNGDISILITEKNREYAHVYEIPSGDELLKSEILIKTATIDCSNVGRREFMGAISGRSPLRGTVETVTHLETSITNGSFKNLRRTREYKGAAKVANYGVYELENNGHSSVYVATEKNAKSDAYREHHTSRRDISASEATATPVESLLRKGEGSEVSNTVVKDLPRKKPSSTTPSPVMNSAKTTVRRRGASTEIYRTEATVPGRYVVKTARHLANISKHIISGSSGNATGTNAATGGSRGNVTASSNYGGGIEVRRQFASLSNSSNGRMSNNSGAWVALGVVVAFFMISAVCYLYRRVITNRRWESNSYRNMYDNAVEEDVSFIRLEPRNAVVDERPATLCMESISDSLTSHDCGSVHEL